MIYHMCSENPYIKKFIEFLLKHHDEFKLNQHIFIMRKNSKFPIELNDVQEQAIKFYKYESNTGFIKVLNENFKENDKIIIHNLSNPQLLLYLLVYPQKLNRVIWEIWGGDVYFFKNRKKDIKHTLIEIIRKIIIPKIPTISSLVKGDFEIVQKQYNSKAAYINAFYPNPLDFELIDSVNGKNKIKHFEKINVLVGNSGDPSNCHLEAFDVLSKFKDKINVFCPLSYGNIEYISKVKSKGTEIFGESFFPILNFLQPKEYLDRLSFMDIVVMNHNRQQGLGNILTMIDLNKKVYIRSDTTSFSFFKHLGVEIYDTLEIKNLDFNDFLRVESESLINNSKIIRGFYSDKNCIEGWKKVFN